MIAAWKTCCKDQICCQPVCRWVVFDSLRPPPRFSLRCFFIAQSYVLVKKWSEALVLYERVLKYAKEVQSKAKSLNNSLKVGDRLSKLERHEPEQLRPEVILTSGPVFSMQHVPAVVHIVQCVWCFMAHSSLATCRISLMSRSSLPRSTLRSTHCRPPPF